MTTKTTDQVILDTLASALGVTAEELVARLAGSAQVQARKPRSIRVVHLTGDQARKFGDVMIQKSGNEGKWINKLGVRSNDLPHLIEDLTQVLDKITS